MDENRVLTKVVSVSWLELVMNTELARRGLSEAARTEIVSGVMFGSLRGIDSHGVCLFRTYLDELSTGRARIHPRFEYRQRRAAVARLDAGGALGIVAGFEAVRKVGALAREFGVGVVVVANSNHFGAASLFTTTLARDGLIGLAMSNSDALVVPVNGRVPRLGTNPISMAASGDGDDVFCADLATSQGSFLRSLARRAEQREMPQGVLADGNGLDAATSGAAPRWLFPLGGHKGQCLGMIVSILCSVLGEAPFDWELSNLFEGPFEQPRQVAHWLLALDVGSVTDPALFRTSLSRYLQVLRTSSALPDLMVSCPGDMESQTARSRVSGGVPITLEDHEFFSSLARQLALPGPANVTHPAAAEAPPAQSNAEAEVDV